MAQPAQLAQPAQFAQPAELAITQPAEMAQPAQLAQPELAQPDQARPADVAQPHQAQQPEVLQMVQQQPELRRLPTFVPQTPVRSPPSNASDEAGNASNDTSCSPHFIQGFCACTSFQSGPSSSMHLLL